MDFLVELVSLLVAMGAPRQKASNTKTVRSHAEVPSTRARKTVTKKTVQSQTEVWCMHREENKGMKCVATQTEITSRDASVQVTGCEECHSLAFAVPQEAGSTCTRCEQLNDLLSLVISLKEEVERLRTIKECEREIDWWCQSLSTSGSRHTDEAPHGARQPLPPYKHLVKGNQPADSVSASPLSSLPPNSNLRREEEWKRVPARRRGHPPSRPSPAPQVPLRNRFEALEVEGGTSESAETGSPVRLPQAKRSPPTLKTASTRKDRRVIVIGDSLLQGTEGPICRPDPTRREVCCLPGARVRDISKKIPRLIRPSDYYPLLIIQAGGEEVDKESLRSIKKDFRGMGRILEGAGVQVVFSSMPVVSGKGTGRIQNTQLFNRWLKSWCRRKNFGFFDHGAIYTAPGMMAADACSLSLRGKRILAEELAGLIDRSLN